MKRDERDELRLLLLPDGNGGFTPMFYWDSDPNPGPQIPRWAIVLLAAFGLFATAILIARVLGGA